MDTPTPSLDDDRPTVFISYSHDSDAHRDRVLALSERLRVDGIETRLDQYENGTPPEGWPRWMLNQLDAATFVLVVCTETYYRRFRGREVPDKGKGVDWEGALITLEIYNARSKTVKFVPVLFEAESAAFIPEPLRGLDAYAPTSEQGYSALYDFLLEQSGVEPAVVGTPRVKPRRKGTPLTFDHPPQAPAAGVYDISRITKYAPAELVGREEELKRLDEAWANDTKRPRVLTFVALGGEGKTSLVAKWAAELAADNWRGCEAAFAWSFYSQGAREQLAASSDLFLKDALAFFGNDEDKAFAASAAGAFEKGQRLARVVGQRRSLLILDGLEPLQYPPTPPHDGALKDQGVTALLKGLAADSRGLCIVTTRYAVPDLKAFRQTTAPEVKLSRLSRDAGVHLLSALGVRGPARELAALVEDVKGHALTLTIIGGYLSRAFGGDVRQRDRVKLEKADQKGGGRAFSAMAAYEEWLLSGGEEGQREVAVLRLMGLFDRPADAGCLAALRGESIPGLTELLAGLSDDDWAYCLSELEAARLLTVNREEGSGMLLSLDAHPLLREYFARQLREEHADAWRAAHRRLYEYLCESTVAKEQPTLEDLQPLYQAVAHGCQADLVQEACDDVFFGRIRRGEESYSYSKLGAFGSDLGAVACFFEHPWDRVSPKLTEADQAWVIATAAFCLSALGRSIEALEPRRVVLKMRVQQESWRNAAIASQNLSVLELMLGDIASAVKDAEQAITHADRSQTVEKVNSVSGLADALHQAGRRAEADTRFREAEQLQAEKQPQYPLLYSVRGFYFCDLLLSGPERAAWQTVLEPSRVTDDQALFDACRAVYARANQTLEWEKGMPHAPIHDIGLHQLTLGRATLYEAVLQGPAQPGSHPPDGFDTARLLLTEAVRGLRRAGAMHQIAQALLSRAWLRQAIGIGRGAESAEADLEEAWEIAERGSMKPLMAEIHLHRARLFFREGKYPWKSPAADLAAARTLIEKCGYWRRKEELEDAEAALKR